MKYILPGLCVLMLACSSTQKAVRSAGQPVHNYTIGGKLYSSLFQQKAAEYRALCFQAYNIAALRIKAYSAPSSMPEALITDIDETILDNSPYAVHQALLGKDYEPATWYQWTSLGAADTMPGAASFLRYAASMGVEIFYVTNREEKERSGTLKNLQRFNLPNADDAHLLLRVDTSSKEPRRRQIMQTHNIVLLMGDNLADFSNLFDKRSVADRAHYADVLSASFGDKFIVFPNPGYGDWESSIYRYKYGLTPARKDSIISAEVKGF